jgi:hypothetical protein
MNDPCLHIKGSLYIQHAGPDGLRASWNGETGIYQLGFERGAWWCSCLGAGTCSHLIALSL